MGIENVDPARIEVLTPTDFIGQSADSLIDRLESKGSGETDLVKGLKDWRARQLVPTALPEVVQLVTYEPIEGEVVDDKKAE